MFSRQLKGKIGTVIVTGATVTSNTWYYVNLRYDAQGDRTKRENKFFFQLISVENLFFKKLILSYREIKVDILFSYCPI